MFSIDTEHLFAIAEGKGNILVTKQILRFPTWWGMSTSSRKLLPPRLLEVVRGSRWCHLVLHLEEQPGRVGEGLGDTLVIVISPSELTAPCIYGSPLQPQTQY